MSDDSAKSYLAVAYELRPSKQVERRMLLDFFRRLSGSGVAIDEFRYTGMGSIQFVDHILFHKFLGIDKLVSVERDEDLESRLRFNRPFDNIELKMMPIGEYVPQLDRGERHIVWLDYDYQLSKAMVHDIVSSANHLPVGSFLLVTIDATPVKGSTGARDNYKYYRDAAGDLWEPRWKQADFVNEELHWRVIEVVARAFKEGVVGRRDVQALPCLSFVYSDGHQMVTLGAQLGGDRETEMLDRVDERGAEYMIRDFDAAPFYINVPVLTRKERLHLESAMPSKDYSKVRSSGLSRDIFDKFGRIYRFFPSYGELLLG